MRIGPTEENRAQMREPTARMREDATRIGLRPWMSASRPATGMATPPASSVAVTTQEALDGEVSSIRGKSGCIGITSDCMSEAHKLENPSTKTARIGAAAALGSVSGVVSAWACLGV